MAFFDMWKNVIMQPKKAFAQMKKPDLAQAAIHLVVAGVISSVIVAAIAMLGGVALGLTGIITTPIMLLIFWVIGSVILLIFAKLLGGKGDFGRHSYMIAMCMAPLYTLFFISIMVEIILVAGGILSALVSLYGLYLLTLAMMYAHGFDMVKAALVWIIPAAIVALILMLTGAAFFGGMAGGILGSIY
jgi:hypothetical protein